MKTYIQANKEAWEEAFEKRSDSFCTNLISRIQQEDYAYFYPEAIALLKQYDLKEKSLAQFCTNNGRELLSLVKSTHAKEGVGFDIAENMVAYANTQAQTLQLPCTFVAANILDIGEEYHNRFDFLFITIGALCWFKDLNAFFRVASACLKEGGSLFIHEQHPFNNMLACEGDEEYHAETPLNCVFSYFDHEWKNETGMGYITEKSYASKPFVDYTHSLSEIVRTMVDNNLNITDMHEYDKDISENFPLSMILCGQKKSSKKEQK